MRRAVPSVLLVLAVLGGASDLGAQGRPKEVECSFLLLSGCRNYVIHVLRVEPGGSEHPQPAADTYQLADPDTLDPKAYLVLNLYDQDGLKGTRSVIWVERQSGSVGGNWASRLTNDAVRSAEMVGAPGDKVELYDDRTLREDRGHARLVIFAGESSCKTPVNLDIPGGACSVREGPRVAGKVSGILIKYRAASAGPLDSFSAPEAPAPGDTVPERPAPSDTGSARAS